MKLGVALSGGGAKGSIHLGILDGLEDEGIKADMYAGTSAGAVVASAKALDMNNKDTFTALTSLDNDLLDINYWGVLKGVFNKFRNLESIANGKNFKAYLETYFNKPMSDVKYPLGIVSSDLNSGAQIIFSSQPIRVEAALSDIIKVYNNQDMKLSEAVYASAAIPGIFPPVEWKKHKLVDGCLVNNLPVNVLKAMGADKVLAINVGKRKGYHEVRGIMNLLNKSIDILIDQNVDYSLHYSDDHMLIYPEMPNIGAFDFNKSAEGYYRGYTYGKRIASDVKRFLEGANQ